MDYCIVCRRKKHSKETIEKLVLPKQCHQIVCKLAHTIPLAGHLGKGKVVKRITKHFYLPTLFGDVAMQLSTVVGVLSAEDLQKEAVQVTPNSDAVF